ncbi:MAG: hypothetical protein N3B21_18180 [Clostridia bacterium]|nr:hypothetical protein [Clostridia bacterium]
MFYVSIVIRYEEGKITPLQVTWEDGRSFEVDKVLDVRRAASLKVGGQGDRYTCRIAGKQVYLFYEDGKWLMEGK